MLRRAIALLPFVAPFVLYGFYFVLVRRRALANGVTAPSLAQAPWIWLVIAGLVLLIISLVGLAIYESSDVSVTYILPRIEDGKVLAGEFG